MEHLSFFLARATLTFAGVLAAVTPAAAVELLSLRAAVQAAVLHSRSLVASTATAQGAREMAVAAAQRPDPVLRLALDNLPVDSPDRPSVMHDSMTMRSISLMQTLPSANKRRAMGQRFEREANAALAQQAQQVVSLQAQVAQAWLERNLQEQRQRLLRAQIDEARLLVQTTDAALRGGSGSTADALATRETLAQLEQGLIAAQADLVNARLTLARYTGTAPEQPLAGLPAILQAPNAATTADTTPEVLANLPEIAALRAGEAVAQADVEIAQQAFTPDWTVELMVSQHSAHSFNTVSIGLSVPLQWDRPQRQQRELAARLARVDALEAEREEQMRERLLQVQRWQQDWRAGLERLAFLDKQRQPLATQRVDVALAAYRGGREGLGPVLQARRDALNLALERLVLERETAGLWAQLEYLFSTAPLE